MSKKDFNKELTIQQKRIESLYEREIKIIVYQIVKQKDLQFIPISNCIADKKFNSIKVLVPFEKTKENINLVENINKKYNYLIVRDLISTKKFRKIPKIFFVFDEEFNKINRIEETIKKNN